MTFSIKIIYHFILSTIKLYTNKTSEIYNNYDINLLKIQVET